MFSKEATSLSVNLAKYRLILSLTESLDLSSFSASSSAICNNDFLFFIFLHVCSILWSSPTVNSLLDGTFSSLLSLPLADPPLGNFSITFSPGTLLGPVDQIGRAHV